MVAGMNMSNDGINLSKAGKHDNHVINTDYAFIFPRLTSIIINFIFYISVQKGLISVTLYEKDLNTVVTSNVIALQTGNITIIGI